MDDLARRDAGETFLALKLPVDGFKPIFRVFTQDVKPQTVYRKSKSHVLPIAPCEIRLDIGIMLFHELRPHLQVDVEQHLFKGEVHVGGFALVLEMAVEGAEGGFKLGAVFGGGGAVLADQFVGRLVVNVDPTSNVAPLPD